MPRSMVGETQKADCGCITMVAARRCCHSVAGAIAPDPAPDQYKNPCRHGLLKWTCPVWSWHTLAWTCYSCGQQASLHARTVYNIGQEASRAGHKTHWSQRGSDRRSLLMWPWNRHWNTPRDCAAAPALEAAVPRGAVLNTTALCTQHDRYPAWLHDHQALNGRNHLTCRRSASQMSGHYAGHHAWWMVNMARHHVRLIGTRAATRGSAQCSCPRNQPCKRLCR